jgi:hypothetical protein
VLLDLSLEISSKAGDHFAGDGARDLLRRRLPGAVVLFNEESFIESLDVGVGFFVHRLAFVKGCSVGEMMDELLSTIHREDIDVGRARVLRRLESNLNDCLFRFEIGRTGVSTNHTEDGSANFVIDSECHISYSKR